MSGTEVQARLVEIDNHLPIIFVTGHGDVPMAVEALHEGAFDFLQKPFRDQELLDRINAALTKSQEEQDSERRKDSVRQRYATLTPREKEVMALVVKGLANKVIALDLDLSQRTVEIHRARSMEKMQARSLADLVRMAMLIESDQ